MEFSDISEYVDGILEVFRENDAPVDPIPRFVLDDSPQNDGPFVKTGFYDPDSKTVVVYTNGRHLKDILRTVSHELVHHSQNLVNGNMLGSENTTGPIVTNPELMSIEGDAYLRGNVYFREWTEKHTF